MAQPSPHQDCRPGTRCWDPLASARGEVVGGLHPRQPQALELRNRRLVTRIGQWVPAMNAGPTAFGWWGRASCTRCVTGVGLSCWATAVCRYRSAEQMAAAAYQAFGFDGRRRQYCLALLAFRAAQTCVALSRRVSGAGVTRSTVPWSTDHERKKP